MTIGDNQRHWHGLPIREFPRFDEELPAELPPADSVAWRIAVDAYDSEEPWEAACARFTEAVDIARVRAIIVGAWSDADEHGPGEVIAALVGASERMPALRALFLGDIDSDECEISYIKQSCVTPLLDAFPELEEFAVRGSAGLAFPAVRHARLRSLTCETGGLPAKVVRGIAASDLPALEQLNLWLGTPEFGCDATVSDLEPFFTGARLPRLRQLALSHSGIQDEIAAAMASAPVVARLEGLDLSMGTLRDTGASALLTGQPLTHLKKFDAHHNFLSEALRTRLRESLEAAGVEVDVSADDVWEYVRDDGPA
ncbi:STM4015 family protein [Streptomyces sp. NPDC051214]|uniref:STM4015 family protein n=1 Tax=Streptomyces sp. NPDC051214 TaxID=3155282 RepID=UPI003419B5E6